jgi:peptide-methionine (R)-S-oxide reductase
MSTRRQFLTVAATTLGLGSLVAWFEQPEAVVRDRPFSVEKSEDVWRASLSPEQYHVLRRQGTERPFSSPLDHETRRGMFMCAACGNPVFSSDTKFDSGTGWPSFWTPVDGATETSVDHSWMMIRTEVHCARCGSHLGHVFPDGPKPTGLRYCMNGVAMRFEPQV